MFCRGVARVLQGFYRSGFEVLGHGLKNLSFFQFTPERVLAPNKKEKINAKSVPKLTVFPEGREGGGFISKSHFYQSVFVGFFGVLWWGGCGVCVGVVWGWFVWGLCGREGRGEEEGVLCGRFCGEGGVRGRRRGGLCVCVREGEGGLWGVLCGGGLVVVVVWGGKGGERGERW